MTTANAQVPPGPVILFVPADRPDRYAKALNAADSIIIDLEDAVAPDRKELAREMLRAHVDELPPDRTLVRVNSPRTAEGFADLQMILSSPLRFVVVPKVEDREEIVALAPLSVVALCETARGVQLAPELAATPGCVGLLWGGEDLTADIGGHSSRGPQGEYLPHVQYTRARVLIAAASARVAAWDGTFLNIADLDGLAVEAREAAAMGFTAKVAIHPSHSAVIRGAYLPSEEDEVWAHRVLAAVEAAESGVASLDGRMIDGPLLTMARNVIAATKARQA